VISKNMKSDGEIQEKGSVGMGNLIVSRTFFNLVGPESLRELE
jgi:hypothetical protein